MKNDQGFKVKFFKELGGLAITLGEQVSKERLQAYYEALTEDHPPDDILNAIRQAVKTCKFFPKPAELIELMTGGKGGGQDPLVAWQTAVESMGAIGSYANVEFADGAIAAAIEGLGGWADLCRMPFEEIKNHRIPAKFAALYAEAVRHGRHLSPGRLYGAIDTENAAKGYDLEAPFIRARTMDEIQAAALNRARLPSPAARPVIDCKPEAQDETSRILDEIEADVARLAARKAM